MSPKLNSLYVSLITIWSASILLSRRSLEKIRYPIIETSTSCITDVSICTMLDKTHISYLLSVSSRELYGFSIMRPWVSSFRNKITNQLETICLTPFLIVPSITRYIFTPTSLECFLHICGTKTLGHCCTHCP